MLIKADVKDLNKILSYCQDEPIMNIFIIGDIELYGVDKEFQDIWMSISDNKIIGVLLRYHENLIVYSTTNEFSINSILTIINEYKIKSISGKKEVIDLLRESLKIGFTVKKMYFAKLINAERLKNNIDNISIATIDDASDIAKAFGQVKEFKGIYSDVFEDRYKQISSRISHKEGIHLFIKDGGKIISHGNTAAETSSAAMIGGLMTIEAYRGRGHSSQIVSMLSKRLVKDHKEVCLLAGNRVENTFVGKLGFKTVGKWCILTRI